MKKVMCMMALAAISFGSVHAADVKVNVKPATMQQDSTKAMKKKMKKMKKDSMKMAKDTMKMKTDSMKR